MEYRNTSNVTKIVACILIASIFMETITAAPVVPDESAQPTQKPKINRNPHQRRNGHAGRKSLGHRKNQFSDKDATTWRNACGSDGWKKPSENEQFQKEAYLNRKTDLEIAVNALSSSMSQMKEINTSEVKTWEELHNTSYSFLPNKPTGIAQKWHLDVQTYTASLLLLHRYQKRKDKEENSNEKSVELSKLLANARSLLCDIEHFVNVTSNRNGQNKISWYTKEEMNDLVKFKNKEEHYLNNIFVKSRFETYVERLQKRLANFKLEKNLQMVKALKPLRNREHQLRKNRKNNQNRRRKVTGESATTPKTFIITTLKPRKNTKVPRSSTRIPKQNRINQKLQ